MAAGLSFARVAGATVSRSRSNTEGIGRRSVGEPPLPWPNDTRRHVCAVASGTNNRRLQIFNGIDGQDVVTDFKPLESALGFRRSIHWPVRACDSDGENRRL